MCFVNTDFHLKPSLKFLLTVQKRPSLQGNEDLIETSRPDSMASNSSFHSTQDELDPTAPLPLNIKADGEDDSVDVSFRPEDAVWEEERDVGSVGSKEEVILLRQALEGVQIKLLETRQENRSLQAQLKPEVGRRMEEDESMREKGREQELIESLAELQAKLTDTQERYHQAVEEVEELRGHIGSGGGDPTDKQDHQRRTSSLEHEVKQLKEHVVQSVSEQEKAAQRVKQLEEALRTVEEERERTAQMEELYKEAQEEIRMLQVNIFLLFLD